MIAAMSETSAPENEKVRLKHRLAGWFVGVIWKSLGVTLRITMEDRAGILQARDDEPFIWSFWHNRVVIFPPLRRRYFPGRPTGATMASQSKDGEWAAQMIRNVGITPIRGSTARGGTAAVREMARVLRRGVDVGITPDGSRGPRYHFKAGLVLLSQISGRPIMPVGVEYARCFRFRSWDGFMIPYPFSRVHVTFGEMIQAKRTHGEEEFEAERVRCEQAMMALVKTY